MAATLEELLLRLKVDQTQVGPAMDQFQAKIHAASGHAHSSLLHVGSAGRAMHRVLEKISEQSPIMGNALRFALSPVVGTLMAATMAFAFFNKKIEEANERLDKMAEQNAKPFGDIAKGAREAAIEVAKLSRELERSVRKEGVARGEKQNATAFELGMDEASERDSTKRKQIEASKEMSLGKVKNDYASGRISQSEMLRRSNSIETSSAGQLRAHDIAAVGHQVGLLQTERVGMLPGLNAAQSEAERSRKALENDWSAKRMKLDEIGIKGAETELENAREAQKVADKKASERGIANHSSMIAAAAAGLTPQQYEELNGNPTASAHAAYQRVQNAQANLAHLTSINSIPEERKVAHEEAVAHQKETEEKAKKLQDRFDELGKAVEKAKQKQEALTNSPNLIDQKNLASISQELLPTIQQLAQSGNWVRRYGTGQMRFQQGPYSQLANELQIREARAPWEAAQGNMGAHNEDVMRIRAIKEELRAAGVMAPADAAEKTEAQLTDINTTLQAGIKVTVANID